MTNTRILYNYHNRINQQRNINDTNKVDTHKLSVFLERLISVMKMVPKICNDKQNEADTNDTAEKYFSNQVEKVILFYQLYL